MDRSSRTRTSPARLTPAAENEIERLRRALHSPASAAACLDGWTCSAPPRAWPIGGSRGQAARQPLRTRTSGRTDPRRLEKTRQDRRHRPPHYRRPHAPELEARHACRYRRCFAPRPHGNPPDEKTTSATAFLARARAFFARHGVTVERVTTDNGSAYKSHRFRDMLAEAGIRHKRTRPYTPRTNGKAERFIKTSLREWIYARPFETSLDRTAAMPAWLCSYKSKRPHSALGGIPPISRFDQGKPPWKRQLD